MSTRKYLSDFEQISRYPNEAISDARLVLSRPTSMPRKGYGEHQDQAAADLDEKEYTS